MTSATNVKPSFRVRSRTPPGRGNVTVTSDILPINVLACPHTAVCGAPNEGVSFSVGFYFFSSKTSPSYYAGSRPLMSLWLTDVISLRTQIRHTHEGRLVATLVATLYDNLSVSPSDSKYVCLSWNYVVDVNGLLPAK